MNDTTKATIQLAFQRSSRSLDLLRREVESAKRELVEAERQLSVAQSQHDDLMASMTAFDISEPSQDALSARMAA